MGYLRPAYGVAVALLAVAGGVSGLRALARGVRLERGGGPSGAPREPGAGGRATSARWAPAALAALVLALWTGLSGSGGIGLQNADHLGANALLRDLVRQPWPLAYADGGVAGGAPYVLVYYVGFYLPAALVGRLAGIVAANLALFAWTLLGVLLAGAWFTRVAEPPRRWWGPAAAAALFALAGGLDWVGWALCNGPLPPWQTHVEWWSDLLQLSSHSTLLLWVPQHAVAAWIAVGVVLFVDLRRLPRGVLGLVGAAAAISTPFATLGLLPFLAVAAARRRPGLGRRDLLTFANLCAAPALALPVGLYLASNAFAFAIEPLWRTDGALSRLALVLFLEAFAFAPCALLALRGDQRAGPRRTWLATALATLVLVSLVRVGHFSDLTMRGSIPALFALFAVVAWALFRLAEARSHAAWVLGALLAVGALTGLSELSRSAAHYAVGQSWAPGGAQRLVDVDIVDLVRQRRGDPDAFFWRHLARPAEVR